MSDFEFSDSVLIAAPPEGVYDLVSDVTRTGEWSPICRECRWDTAGDGTAGGPRAGATFTGVNVDGAREWTTTSTVEIADRGREFSWLVAGGLVRWAYTMAPAGDDTRLTESWEFRPAGRDHFRAKYGDDAQAQIDNRVQAAHAGIPATLAAIKAVLERG